MEQKEKLKIIFLLSYLSSPTLWGCVSPQPKLISSETPQITHDYQADQISQLNQRIQELELKVSSLNDKLEISAQRHLAQIKKSHIPQKTQIQKPPTEEVEDLSLPLQSKKDPESGFSDDASIRSYRQAMISFQAHKYPETILELTDFIGKYPDHILAGSAQYYCAESYYQQNEFKLALKEFEIVLTSYPNSQHISDTLHRVSELSNQLKMKENAQKSLESLNSQFAHSPAGWASNQPVTAPPPTLAPTPEPQASSSPSTPQDQSVNQENPSSAKKEDHGT